MAPDTETRITAVQNENATLWSLPETLREFVETGDQEMVTEILTLFQDDSAERLQLLNQSLSEGNRDAVRKQAHALKGASSQVGAQQMSELCREMEVRANGAPQSDLLDLAWRICDCYDRTCRVIFENRG